MAQFARQSVHQSGAAPAVIPLTAALGAFPDGVAVCGRDGIIVAANPALHRLSGYPQGTLVGLELGQLLPRIGVAEALNAAMVSERRDSVARRTDGALLPVEVTLGSFRDGAGGYLLATVRDIARRLHSEQQLRDCATRDGLTGLLNRTTLMQVGEVEILRARRYSRSVSLIMIDVDHFKRINDAHGHPAGDQVLQAVAETCRRSLRSCDVVARYGGEEFVILLPETGTDGAVNVAERIRRNATRIALDSADVAITISAGVAVLGTGILDLGALISAADRALYRAKRTGRDRVEIA